MPIIAMAGQHVSITKCSGQSMTLSHRFQVIHASLCPIRIDTSAKLPGLTTTSINRKLEVSSHPLIDGGWGHLTLNLDWGANPFIAGKVRSKYTVDV